MENQEEKSQSPQEEKKNKQVLVNFLESKNVCMLNPLCHDADDEDFGKRFPGGFSLNVVDEGHPCTLITYDNGDQYLFDTTEEILYELGKFDQWKMIHKYFERIIYDCADKHFINTQRPIYCDFNEVHATSFIRLIIDHDEKTVFITNILIPFEKKHKNIGKDLISDIFQVCKKLGYRLILIDVVPHFIEALRRRGAIVDDTADSVEITETTDLKSRFKKRKKK